MSDEIKRSAKVGDLEIQVARFRGFKAQKIMRECAAIARSFPEITKLIGQFERDYVELNALSLSRVEAELRYGDRAREISEAAWEATGDLKLKRMPEPYERLAAILPELLDAAEAHVRRLLAIVSMSNEELKEADAADAVDERLDERARDLFHDGEVDELVDLGLAGYAVAREQFAPLVEKLEPMLGLLGIPTIEPEDELEEEPEATSDTSPTSPETSPTSPPSSETRVSSSTDSPTPTDGTETPSSTAPPGERSEPSPVV